MAFDLDAYTTAVADAAPPLTPDAAARIRALLWGPESNRRLAARTAPPTGQPSTPPPAAQSGGAPDAA